MNQKYSPSGRADAMNHSAGENRAQQTEHNLREEFRLEAIAQHQRFQIRNSLRLQNCRSLFINNSQDLIDSPSVPE